MTTERNTFPIDRKSELKGTVAFVAAEVVVDAGEVVAAEVEAVERVAVESEVVPEVEVACISLVHCVMFRSHPQFSGLEYPLVWNVSQGELEKRTWLRARWKGQRISFYVVCILVVVSSR